jgi:hypothetical protein
MARDPDFTDFTDLGQAPVPDDPLLDSVEADPVTELFGEDDDPAGAFPPDAATADPAAFDPETPDPETPDPAPEDQVVALGAALAEAAEVLEPPKPRASASRSIDRYLLTFIACYLVFMTMLWLWPARNREVRQPDPGEQSPPAGVDVWSEAFRAAREKRHVDAIALFERHLGSSGLASDERLLVYQQLAIQCRLAGRLEEAMRYAGLAQVQTNRIFPPEDLLRLAEQAYAEGRTALARRLFARLLLIESSFPEHMKDRAPLAALRLADSYRAEAERAEAAK